jgi:hypothetical protein
LRFKPLRQGYNHMPGILSPSDSVHEMTRVGW